MDSVLQYFFRNFFGCLTLSSLTRRLPIYNSFFHWCFIFPFQTMCGVLAQIELFRRPVHVHMYTYRFMKTEANSFKNIVWSESIPICAFVSQKRSEQEKTKDGCGMGEWWKTTNIAFLPFFLPSYAFFLSALTFAPLATIIGRLKQASLIWQTNKPASRKILLSLSIPNVLIL